MPVPTVIHRMHSVSGCLSVRLCMIIYLGVYEWDILQAACGNFTEVTTYQ